MLKTVGLKYRTADDIALRPLENIITRVNAAKNNIENGDAIKAILGGVEPPCLKLSNALELFWDYARPRISRKTPDELRKWKNPRKRTIKSFISVVGDLELTKLKREHTLQYRDWWMDRIDEENLSPNTVNKQVCSNLKDILQTLNDNYEPALGLDINHLFDRLRLPPEDVRRPPYSREFVENTLLDRRKLRTLGEDEWFLICIMASTGCGTKEIVTRSREDIVLDHDIPHLIVRPNEHVQKAKTKFRSRVIPLVGSALFAFKQRPDGFERHRKIPDSLGSSANKYLRENGLRETDKQSIYSLRHTFQDGLTALEIGDRMECDLMGHSFKAKAGRAKYGQGPSLEHKLKVMKKVAFDVTL